jgi:hypothetical protein
MDSDGYTPAISLDELAALAKIHGPACLTNAGDPSVSRDLACHSVEQAPGIDRWENEGGSPVDSESDDSN